MVGLEVLRGAVDSREGTGLREIDGWYHVLDDLQRPQGQIKVRSWVFQSLLLRAFFVREGASVPEMYSSSEEMVRLLGAVSLQSWCDCSTLGVVVRSTRKELSWKGTIL